VFFKTGAQTVFIFYKVAYGPNDRFSPLTVRIMLWIRIKIF